VSIPAYPAAGPGTHVRSRQSGATSDYLLVAGPCTEDREIVLATP
jgi:hypothetical protein